VCRNIINDAVSIQFSDNLDIITRLSTDLENEGVIMSNEKILKVVLALRTLAKTYYKVYVKMTAVPVEEGAAAVDHIAELNPRFVYQLQMRTSLKEGIIQALVVCMETMLRQQISAVGDDGLSTSENAKKLF